MKKEFKSALNKVKSTEALKQKTLEALRQRAEQPVRQKAARPGFRLAVAAACVLFFVLAGGVSYAITYLAPTSFLDIETNPKISVELNRFNRVVGLRGHNEEGFAVVELIGGSNIRFSSYDEAMVMLLDATAALGYVTEDGLVSVGVQANERDEENLILSTQQIITDWLEENIMGTQVEVFSVQQEDVTTTRRRQRQTERQTTTPGSPRPTTTTEADDFDDYEHDYDDEYYPYYTYPDNDDPYDDYDDIPAEEPDGNYHEEQPAEDGSDDDAEYD